MAPTQQHHMSTTAQVAEKVMRRIEIAKVARNLQDCLAFASFKAQNGWQDRTLSTIEPEITEKLARRKRPYPEDINIPDNSTTGSEGVHSSSSQPAVSSDPAQSYAESRKRVRASSSSGLERSGQHAGWRQNSVITQSSPVPDRPHTMEAASYPSLQDSPMFDAPSSPEEGEHENKIPSMQEPSSSIISSSPPRTPPPNRRTLTNTKQAGADLLLYLANSPRTPAVHVQHISSTSKDPATPPHQHTNLPSSVMQTPGNLGLFNGALQTPGNFNLADFCNVTPSPGQAQFNHQSTPAMGRTPHRSTRRGLNFDSLVPPSPSNSKQSQGLALHLGEELNRQ